MLKPFFSRLIDALLALLIINILIWFIMTSPVLSLFVEQSTLPTVDKDKLQQHVTMLTSPHIADVVKIENPPSSEHYIHQVFAKYTQVSHQPFKTNTGTVNNVIAHFGPDTKQRIVIGAHYDALGSFTNTRTNNDHASGIAGLLELATLLAQQKTLPIRVELVAYALAKGEYFDTKIRGSFHHAETLKRKHHDVVLMLSMDSIGYFSQQPNSQHYPYAFMQFFYPSTGNYIKISGRPQDLLMIRQVKKSFRKIQGLAVQSLTAPELFPSIGLSDNQSYWKQGYAALCITDSATDRKPLYRSNNDLANTLDYATMAKVVQGVGQAIIDVSHPFTPQHDNLAQQL